MKLILRYLLSAATFAGLLILWAKNKPANSKAPDVLPVGFNKVVNGKNIINWSGIAVFAAIGAASMFVFTWIVKLFKIKI